jgi:hypothetical protein
MLAAVPASAAGFKVLVDSALRLDPIAGTITLPLFQGTHRGRSVWYVVIDSSDRDDARARGVN